MRCPIALLQSRSRQFRSRSRARPFRSARSPAPSRPRPFPHAGRLPPAHPLLRTPSPGRSCVTQPMT